MTGPDNNAPPYTRGPEQFNPFKPDKTEKPAEPPQPWPFRPPPATTAEPEPTPAET